MPWIEMGDRPAPGMKAHLRETRPWYEFRNAASDEAELLLFDEIGGWFSPTAEEIITELKAITAPRLKVRINSPGGSVFEGIALANALREHPAEVTVQVDGLAASIASVIALAGDRLVMMPNSMFMIHDASGGCWGQSSDMQQMAELLDKVSDNIADAYAAKAGGTRADWRTRMLAETWYSPEEAVEAGLADEVARPSRQPDQAPDEPMAARWDLSVFRFAGRAAAPDPTPAAAPATEPEPDPVAAVAPATGPDTNLSIEQEFALFAEESRELATELGAEAESTPAEAPVPVLNGPAPDQPSPAPSPVDEWTALAAHLTNPPSIEDEWARLREALL